MVYDPPVLDDSAPLFRQTVSSESASATWQALAGVDGAYQLLWCETTGPRRTGHGSAVLREALRQAALHSEKVGRPMRRMIALVPQREVIARAWIMRNGFVHAHTLDDLDAGRAEVLVMVRTFD